MARVCNNNAIKVLILLLFRLVLLHLLLYTGTALVINLLKSCTINNSHKLYYLVATLNVLLSLYTLHIIMSNTFTEENQKSKHMQCKL